MNKTRIAAALATVTSTALVVISQHPAIVALTVSSFGVIGFSF